MVDTLERHKTFCSIAVVIPCYNAETFIRQAIQSAIDQKYPALEIIVVDDGSTDGTAEIVKSFGDRVILESSANRGGCHARNLGTALTKAEFVLYLDADDYLHGKYLLQLSMAADAAPDVIIGAVLYFPELALSGPMSYATHENAHSLLCSYLRGFLQTSGFLWRRSFIQNYGGWKEGLSVYQDVDLGIRMLLKSPKVAYPEIENAYAVYRHHNANPRVSYTIDRQKSGAKIAILKTYRDEILNLRIPELRSMLGWKFYQFAAEAFAVGHCDIGRLALAEAKSLGIKPFSNGYNLGEIVAAVVGLEWKIRLMALSYKIFPRPRRFPYNLISS